MEIRPCRMGAARGEPSQQVRGVAVKAMKISIGNDCGYRHRLILSSRIERCHPTIWSVLVPYMVSL